jgi:hypothetical protein
VGIDFTFDAERHLYLVQGKPVPSVTQVLHSAGLSADYSMVAPEVLERNPDPASPTTSSLFGPTPDAPSQSQQQGGLRL